MSETYVTRETRKDEIAKVIEFLNEYHAKEDVIAEGFKKKHPTNSSSETAKISAGGFISRYPSLVVVHSEEIVGAVVLYPAEDDLKKSDVQERSLELNNAIIGIFIDSGFYDQLDNTRMLKIRKLGVHREHRGKGLAKMLLEASVNWAKNNGYNVVFGMFSHPAAKKAAERVGFVKYLDYDVRKLKDSEGRELLADCSPNNVITLMTKTIA